MKEQALKLAEGVKDPNVVLNRMREYIQAFVMRSFHESEAFHALAFLGGTALRFLHGLPRFSEDLDFSIVSLEDYHGKEWMTRVKRDLTLAGFKADITWNDRKTVHAGWIRVANLLHEARISDMPDQKLSIKVEIDTHPPTGAQCERRIITRYMTFAVQHYDLPSLLSGKLHAAITRRYFKGRDWYDLIWYLSQIPPVTPNLRLLQNALDQTQGAARLDAHKWKTLVLARLEALNLKTVRDDVLPFLERPQDAELLTRDHLIELFNRI